MAKLTSAQKLYREILSGNHGRSVEFVANVIMTGCSRPTKKLRGLLNRLAAGQEIGNGNSWHSLRIDGVYYDSLQVLEERL